MRPIDESRAHPDRASIGGVLGPREQICTLSTGRFEIRAGKSLENRQRFSAPSQGAGAAGRSSNRRRTAASRMSWKAGRSAFPPGWDERASLCRRRTPVGGARSGAPPATRSFVEGRYASAFGRRPPGGRGTRGEGEGRGTRFRFVLTREEFCRSFPSMTWNCPISPSGA